MQGVNAFLVSSPNNYIRHLFPEKLLRKWHTTMLV
jgi:hypothetical protein